MPEGPPPRASIPVRLVLPSTLLPAGTPARSGADRVATRVKSELTRLARTLGIPGPVELELEPSPGTALQLFVHGRECRYPRETVNRVWSACEGLVLTAAPRLAGEHAPEQSGARASEVVAGVCREIIARRPSRLLGRGQVARYVRRTPAAHVDHEWALAALRRVLDARIAISEKEAVTELLADMDGRLSRQAGEAIIARLRAKEICVLIRRAHLRDITLGPDAGARSVVEGVRSRIEEEFGVAMPVLRFAEDRSLHPRSFAFRLNDLTILPWIGLPPDTCLVNESVETMAALGMPAQPAANPLTEIDNAVVPMSRHADVERFHLRAWTPLEYFGLCLEATVRRYASCVIDTETVRSRLDSLEAIGSVHASIGRRLPAGRVVRVMRTLLDEGVSVSDFPAIVEVLAEQHERFRQQHEPSDPIWSEESDVVADRRDAEAVASARRRLGRQVAAKVVSDAVGQPLVAVVLDDPLHQIVAAACAVGEPLAPDEAELLNRSVRAAMRRWPGTQWPALLTTAALRGTLRATLAPEFPDLPVVAFEELPVHVGIGEARTIEAAATFVAG